MQQPLSTEILSNELRPHVPASPAPPEEVVALTRELFGSQITVERCNDPEFPTESYFAFTVDASGDPAPFHALELEWARRMARLEPQTTDIRLRIVYRG